MKRNSSNRQTKVPAPASHVGFAWRAQGRNVRHLVALFLLTVSPVWFFLLPLVLYNENSFAGNETVLLWTMSLGAWRDLGISLIGAWGGIKLWRQSAGAERFVRWYLGIVLASALALLVFSIVNPQASCFHREICLAQAMRWLEAILVCIIVQGGLLLARGREQRDGPDAITPISGLSHPVQASLAGVIMLGTGLALATPHVQPKDAFEAAWRGDVITLREFLKNGIEVNDADSQGSSLLHYAHSREAAALLMAEHSHQEAKYLLTALDLKDSSALTTKLRHPQDGATVYLRAKLSAELREDIDGIPTGNPAPLEVATRLAKELNSVLRGNSLWESSRFERVILSDDLRWLCGQPTVGLERTRLNRLLLEAVFPAEIARYQVDWRNHLAETPLHWAAQNNCPGVAALLLDHGANANALSQRSHNPNLPGWTPLDYAICGQTMWPKQNFEEVIQLLISHGGQAFVMQHRLEAAQQGIANHSAIRQALVEPRAP